MSVKSTRPGISIASATVLAVAVLWGSTRGVDAASAPPQPIGIERAAGGALDTGAVRRVVVAHLDEESVPSAENPGAPVLGGDAPETNPGPSADWERLPAAVSPPAAGNSAPAATAPNGAAQSATAGSSAGAGAPQADASANADASASGRMGGIPAPIRPDVQPRSRPAAPVATVASAQRASATDTTGAARAAEEQHADLGPPPALDLGAIQSGPDLSSMSLAGEFKKADTPARAAALRVTEQARVDLADGNIDGALRDLGRAVSIDPGNPFEYFYLGRAYLARGNYAQALTFFERAEIGFASRPDWLGETVGFEGACDEELGQMSKAALAYRRALGSAPGNLRARVGYSRLAEYLPSTATADASAPTGGEAPPPPERTAAGPAPAEPPPLPPPVSTTPGEAQKNPSGADQPD